MSKLNPLYVEFLGHEYILVNDAYSPEPSYAHAYRCLSACRQTPKTYLLSPDSTPSSATETPEPKSLGP